MVHVGRVMIFCFFPIRMIENMMSDGSSTTCQEPRLALL